jgi:saccharopine dehydrogenase-like NADP-dependent oxidoreductase
MRFVVLGGAGAMGRITVRDLIETSPADAEIVVADTDPGRAAAVAAPTPRRAVVPIAVNVRDVPECVRVLEAALARDPGDKGNPASDWRPDHALRGERAKANRVLINTAPFRFNLEAMEIALGLHAHYIDLGGLFHMTRQQLTWDGRFRAIGRTALVGMGAAPGITNLLARVAADRLDRVAEIHTRVGSLDRTRYDPPPALNATYSLETVMQEFSVDAAVFTKGRVKFVPPMSGESAYRFPPPIGLRRAMYILHSEVATLPLSFRSKGVREVTFKIAFDAEFVDRIRFLKAIGFGSAEPIDVDGRPVSPVDVLNRLVLSRRPTVRGLLRQYEIVRAVVYGERGGRKATVIADCHTAGMPAWGIGLDIDTGSPPAIAAQMLAHGDIDRVGVVPPELAVPPKPFFRELARRKMTLRVADRKGWQGA